MSACDTWSITQEVRFPSRIRGRKYHSTWAIHTDETVGHLRHISTDFTYGTLAEARRMALLRHRCLPRVMNFHRSLDED